MEDNTKKRLKNQPFYFIPMRLWKVLGLLILLSGCFARGSHFDGLPQWITNPDSDNPNDTHLVATGSAPNLETAKAAALQNLSAILRVRAYSVSTTNTLTKTKKSDKEESFSQENQSNQNIQISVDELLQGAQITKVFFNPSNHQYYAQAKLERTLAGRMIRKKIFLLDEKLDDAIYFTQKNQTLSALLKLQEAKALYQKRITLSENYQVITKNSIANPFQNSDFDEKLKILKKNNSFQIRTHDSILKNLLSSQLSKFGFSIKKDNARYTLSASLEKYPSYQKGGWYWQEMSLNLKIILTQEQTLIQQNNAQFREGSAQKSSLSSKVEKTLSYQISTLLKSLLKE